MMRMDHHVRKGGLGMAEELVGTDSTQPYLEVMRLEDGRYCVQFRRSGTPLRKSYAPHAQAVVKQAQRAGHIPVQTTDEELRQLCQEHQVQLV
jgi:hypothetical protein